MNNKLKVVIILCILLITCSIGYRIIISRKVATKEFENELVKLAEKNEIPVFYLQKIILYSSAGIVDNSESKNLSNIDISQYTDIAIYLKNQSLFLFIEVYYLHQYCMNQYISTNCCKQ